MKYKPVLNENALRTAKRIECQCTRMTQALLAKQAKKYAENHN